MTQIQVIYDPPTKAIQQSFTIDPTSCDSLVCVLKRAIYESQGILPLNQRLSLEGNTDNFTIPTRVICKILRNRNPNQTIIISGFNQDIYKFTIDTNNDNILDLKFLLGQCIKEKPEYIQLMINNNTMANNKLIKNINIIFGDAAADNNIYPNRFWLEYPSRSKGHGSIHRTSPQLLDIDPNYPTVPHMLRKVARQQPNDAHLGTRKFIGNNGERGEYEWITFKQLNDRVSNLASGFRYLGLKPKQTRLGICAINRVEWSVADYAGHTQRFVTVPLYDTLAKNAIEYIINHAAVQIVVCTKETLKEIVKVRHKCLTLKYIVLCDDYESDKEFVRKNQQAGFTHTISQLEAIGARNNHGKMNDILPSPDDIATICYTSGTTGDPKGVILTHRNLLSSVASIMMRMPAEEIGGNDDAVLSYLPLAHIYQRIVELFCLRIGARVGYFNGNTDLLLEDIQALKPTVFVGVPRVFQKIKDKTFAQVGQSNFIRRFLFNQAYAAKQSNIEHGLAAPAWWEKIVISKVKAKFGGRIKACISGSAPLSIQTAKFMKTCLSDMVGEGYGLTETSASGTSSDAYLNTFGHVGTPTPNLEIKLVNVEEEGMSYLISDKPHARGEIWIRGKSVFKGYYKNELKTNSVLTADGWFKTGDIGLWNSSGKLKIIDRKKNIFKLAQGEYIRPEYIENVYKLSPYINNVFVYGDSNYTFLVAIIVPDFEVVLEWVKQNVNINNDFKDYDALCKNSNLINLIRFDMERIAKQEQLNGFEQVKRFILYNEEFSVDNGLLTSTLKLKRHFAKKYFQQQIDVLYKQVASSKL